MDTLFVLGQESRLRILRRAAARIPGCAYLCAWAALPLPLPAATQPPPPPPPSPSSSSLPSPSGAARLLCCLDAWLCCDDDAGDGDGDGDGDAARRVRALFDAYRGSLCAAVSGCVPGWAYKDGRAYMDLPAHDLAASASLPVQQQFYQMAAFMGYDSGEIEIGMSTAATTTTTTTSGSSPMGLESSLQQVFSEDFFQQSLLEELLQLPPTRPSSPSSSLPSASVDSPAADASTPLHLVRTMAVTPAAAPSSSSGERPQAPVPAPVPVPVPLPPLLPRPAPPAVPVLLPFGLHGGHVHFPSAAADDAAMAQAMLDVISASSSAALMPTPSPYAGPPPPCSNHRARRWPRRSTAFRPYSAALAPRAPWRPPGGAPAGQRMIKMGMSILRRMHVLRLSRERAAGGTGTGGAAAVTVAPRGQRQQHQMEEDEDHLSPAAPTGSQLNHMISERRRRERLNESFEALRGLLPPGSKKDKATVLAKTLDYMNILVSQIADLEARNRSLLESSRAAAHQQQRTTTTNGGSSKENNNSRRPATSSEQQQAAAMVLQQGLTTTGTLSERAHVRVSTSDVADANAASTSSADAPPPRELAVRVEARALGDVGELVARALAAIKEAAGRRRLAVVAVDARQPSGGVALASFSLRATAGGFDEAALREAVRKAAEDSSAAAAAAADDDDDDDS
ncbi:hypothetical protein U9M48_025170 [Paspalum notatum var. saurae]|uniref:BHLH domain-containing protein n=1 Tax=Paspalum notatum var. saurae TaxID=547442 RepID=A0AAQ3TT00_PASNO